MAPVTIVLRLRNAPGRPGAVNLVPRLMRQPKHAINVSQAHLNPTLVTKRVQDVMLRFIVPLAHQSKHNAPPVHFAKHQQLPFSALREAFALLDRRRNWTAQLEVFVPVHRQSRRVIPDHFARIDLRPSEIVQQETIAKRRQKLRIAAKTITALKDPSRKSRAAATV
jgi:hypothetical protein